MQRIKIKLTAISVIAILLTVLSQGTLSFYTVTGTARNVITSGEIKAQIIEKMGDSEFPKEGVYVMPGSIVSKKVTVANTGGHPFWLRVMLTNGEDNKPISNDLFIPDINLTDWINGGDGYYYYKTVVEPDTETAQLFSVVKIAGNVDNKYNGKSVELTVNAFAVQSENNSADSPLDVAGWPSI